MQEVTMSKELDGLLADASDKLKVIVVIYNMILLFLNLKCDLKALVPPLRMITLMSQGRDLKKSS